MSSPADSRPAEAARLVAARLVAARALRVDGDLPAPRAGAHVVELEGPSMIAAGQVPWGVAGPLAEIDPAATAEQLAPGPTVDALARAAGRPLVIVVRDLHRYPDQRDMLAALLADRPDAIVVDMGWPAPLDPALGAPVRIVTHGASRASGEAVARLLDGTAAR
jgi:beta-N-acetylhexosaminidase